MARAAHSAGHRRAVAVAGGGGRIIAFPRGRRRDAAGARLVELVAELRGLSPPMLLQPTRCDAPTAAARQLAMYLMHVVLGRNYLDTGRYFRRDRTTVAHACAHIEDLRDDPGFEAEVAALERALGEDDAEEATRGRA